MRIVAIVVAAAALCGCGTTSGSNPQLIAAQTFEGSWTGLDAATKLVKSQLVSGKLVAGSPTALQVASDLKTATAMLTAADDARLGVGGGTDVTADVLAATNALADISTLIGSK